VKEAMDLSQDRLLLELEQDPDEVNGDNLNNIERETSRHFRNKKREYLKDNID
jgi:hypothetical protein